MFSEWLLEQDVRLLHTTDFVHKQGLTWKDTGYLLVLLEDIPAPAMFDSV